jgi:plasmid stabilization system protein ParE
MTRRLVFAPTAQRDLDETLAFIAKDKPGAALRFVERIKKNASSYGIVLRPERIAAKFARECGGYDFRNT